MATELNTPSALPMSRNGSCLFGYTGNVYFVDGLKFNTGDTSGWTQLDGSEEVLLDEPIIAFTQRDSPRTGGKVSVIVNFLENSNELKFQIAVQECSNGHKFWLNQTITIVYNIIYIGGEEEVTFTYTLTADDFKTTPSYPTVMPDEPFFWYLNYGYRPANDTVEGGIYFGVIAETITVTGYVLDYQIKSAEASPNEFFQPPGD
jgi:hypothetical protein